MEPKPPVSHDQNFKNLILDYPRQALEFFSPEEFSGLDDDTRILPVRQEQLKERLGNRFRELDVPLLVEWPNGRREALLFVLEEETDPRRFSIHRLAHYCLDLSELCETSRVVPVVVFLNSRGGEPVHLSLGGDRHEYLHFHYVRCALQELDAEDYWDSDNLIARLCLFIKYIDFIDIYSALDDNEMEQYRAQYPQEDKTMASLSERLRSEGMAQGLEQGIEKGMQKGMAEGMQTGERAVLIRLLSRRFGSLSAETLSRLDNANQQQLEAWADRILDARTLEEVFLEH